MMSKLNVPRFETKLQNSTSTESVHVAPKLSVTVSVKIKSSSNGLIMVGFAAVVSLRKSEAWK